MKVKTFKGPTAGEDVQTESNHSTKCSAPVRLCLRALGKPQSRENFLPGEGFTSSP